MSLTIHSTEAFASHIEHCVTRLHMTYMDAVLDFCEKHQLDPEMIVPFLTTKMRTVIQHDAQSLHLIAKRRELPFDE